MVDYVVGMGTMEMAIVSSSNELPPVLLPAVYLLQSPIDRSKVLWRTQLLIMHRLLYTTRYITIKVLCLVDSPTSHISTRWT